MIENIRLSFKGILSHKIRSFLTMLGIIIGIAAIIAIVSTIKGTNEQIKNNLIGAGNNTVKIQLSNGDTVCDFSYEAPPSNVAMFTSDTKKRINELKEVESSTFYRTRNNPDNLFYLNNKMDSSTIYGVDKDYFDTVGYEIVEGKGFADVLILQHVISVLTQVEHHAVVVVALGVNQAVALHTRFLLVRAHIGIYIVAALEGSQCGALLGDELPVDGADLNVICIVVVVTKLHDYLRLMSPALHLVRSVVNSFVRIGCVSISVLFYIILSCRIGGRESENRRKISAGLFQFDHNGLIIRCFPAFCHI